MGKILALVYLVLIIGAITDCARRNANQAWLFVIILFPLGPLIYFAWTGNWLGRALRARRAVSDSESDFVGEGTPAQLQKKGAQLVRRGRHSEAVEVLEELLEHEGPAVPPKARYDIAMAYKALGRFRDARDQLSLIIGKDPEYLAGQAFLELADCFDQMGDSDKALRSYEQLLRYTRFPQARYNYGMLLDRMGRKDEAAEQMKMILHDMDKAPEFFQKDNRRFAKMAQQYVETRNAEG